MRHSWFALVKLIHIMYFGVHGVALHWQGEPFASSEAPRAEAPTQREQRHEMLRDARKGAGTTPGARRMQTTAQTGSEPRPGARVDPTRGRDASLLFMAEGSGCAAQRVSQRSAQLTNREGVTRSISDSMQSESADAWNVENPAGPKDADGGARMPREKQREVRARRGVCIGCMMFIEREREREHAFEGD